MKAMAQSIARCRQLVQTRSVDEGPQLLAAAQILTGKEDPSRYGQVVALVFSEEITRTSAQDGLDAVLLTHYQVEANQVLGAALQPGGRGAVIAARRNRAADSPTRHGEWHRQIGWDTR